MLPQCPACTKLGVSLVGMVPAIMQAGPFPDLIRVTSVSPSDTLDAAAPWICGSASACTHAACISAFNTLLCTDQ